MFLKSWKFQNFLLTTLLLYLSLLYIYSLMFWVMSAHYRCLRFLEKIKKLWNPKKCLVK